MPYADPRHLENPQRLAALQNSYLLDTPSEEAFDRLTRLASLILDVPVSLVSLVDINRQFFKSQVGLPEPWASQRETPLSHSFCQHVVATKSPLIIEDSRQHPLVHDNRAIPDLNVISYIGIPLITHEGQALGSFCAIDSQPHIWTEREIHIMQELAQSTISEIELRREVRARRQAQHMMERSHLHLDKMRESAAATLTHALDMIEQGREACDVTAYLATAKRTFKKSVTTGDLNPV